MTTEMAATTSPSWSRTGEPTEQTLSVQALHVEGHVLVGDALELALRAPPGRSTVSRRVLAPLLREDGARAPAWRTP